MNFEYTSNINDTLKGNINIFEKNQLSPIDDDFPISIPKHQNFFQHRLKQNLNMAKYIIFPSQ